MMEFKKFTYDEMRTIPRKTISQMPKNVEIVGKGPTPYELRRRVWARVYKDSKGRLFWLRMSHEGMADDHLCSDACV